MGLYLRGWVEYLKLSPNGAKAFMMRSILACAKRLIRRSIGDPSVLLEEMPDGPGLFRYYRRLLATGHERVPGGWRYEGKFYPDYLTVGGAMHAILPTAMRYCRGRGVDLGAGDWPFPGALPVDPKLGADGASLKDFADGSLDFVFSSHALEHIENWREELEAWVKKLRPEGVLFLYLPHPECGLWRMDNPFMAPFHRWIPEPELVKSEVSRLGLQILTAEDGPDSMFSFFICAVKSHC